MQKFMSTAKLFTSFIVLSLLFSCNQQPTLSNFKIAINKDDLKTINKLSKTVDLDTLRFFNNRTILHQAVLQNATSIAKKFIDESLFLNKIDSSGQTAFIMAVMNNNNTIAEHLLLKDINLNTVDNLNGYASIHYAVNNENLELVKKIVEKGAAIDIKTGSIENTALHRAIYKENPAIINILRENNAIDTISNLNGDNAIDYAVESSNIDVLNIFLKDFSIEDKKKLLYTAIKSSNEHPLLDKLLKESWVTKKTLQENFIYTHNTTTAKKLINYGCNEHYISKEKGYGAIHHAAIRGDVAMLEFLLENGADINTPSGKNSNDRRTPLMHAAALYDELTINQKIGNSVISLSSSFEDIMGVSSEKTKENSLEAVQLLIKNGADLNYVNAAKENALYIAASTFNHNVKALLIEKKVAETKAFKPTSSQILSRLNN